MSRSRHPVESLVQRSGAVALSCLLATGCATAVRTIRADPQEERLERLLTTVTPHTDHPDAHYWVRVFQPPKRQRIDLWILHQRHIYLSEALLEQADDEVLTAILAHGIAHHELRHYAKRGIVQSLQYVAFLVGGVFVPGLSFGWFAADPIVEGVMSMGQEFTADAKTLTYLEKLDYSPEAYIRALEFLKTHDCVERTGGILTTQKGFSSRINAIRKRRDSPTTTNTAPDTETQDQLTGVPPGGSGEPVM